MLDVD